MIKTISNIEIDAQELIDFAQKNHDQFCNFSRENIGRFFVEHAANVIVRKNKKTNEINGFAVAVPIGEKEIEMVTTCLSDSYSHNRRDMYAFVKRLKSAGYKVTWKRETTGDNIFGIFSDINCVSQFAATG